MGELSEQLKRFPIFREADLSRLCRLEKRGGIRVFRAQPGERIDRAGCAVSCINHGSAAVYSLDEERPVLLRYLKAGELFGAASVFSGEAPISRVEAKEPTEILEVTRAAVSELLDTDAGFRSAFVAFLSDRIRFLNLRVSCVSAGSAERKLGYWLCSLSDEDSFDLPVSMSDLANLLDLGRASLYRAFDKLTSLGWLKRDGPHVELLDRRSILKETY